MTINFKSQERSDIMDQAAYFNQMREKRKREILTAARKMLLKDGTASFTMQKLAKKLDISTVTLYKYFKNMEDIMTAIADEIIPRTIALTLDESEKIIQASTPFSPLEQFLQLFHSFFNEILKHKDDLTLLLLIDTYSQDIPAIQKQSNKIALYTDALNTRTEQLLLDALKNGELKNEIDIPHSLTFIHTITLSTLQHIGLLSAKEFKNQRQELQTHVDEIIAMFRVYLTA